jgi:hypothetical protein
MAVFRKKPPAAPAADAPPIARVEWPLAQLVGRVKDAAPALEAWEVDTALVHARLADHYRDLGLAPPPAADFARQSTALDVEGWRRLALAVALLDDAELRSTLALLVSSVPVGLQVDSGFLGLAHEIAPLTVALVRQNATRAEEFARHLAMRLKIGIQGEDDRDSRMRLYEIDYKRLLAEAEEARAAAQEKMDRLRQKQSDADRRRRRGKW